MILSLGRRATIRAASTPFSSALKGRSTAPTTCPSSHSSASRQSTSTAFFSFIDCLTVSRESLVWPACAVPEAAATSTAASTARAQAVPPAWFHGIRASTIAIPQASVIPANNRPHPTKAARPAPTFDQSGSGQSPAVAAPRATSAPAAIRTWRSSDIALRP